jgi:acyl carrier protein
MEEEIKEILAELLENEEVKEIGLEEDLINYGLDSLHAIELVVSLEEKYSITFEEEDLLLEKISSMDKIISTVQKYQNM